MTRLARLGLLAWVAIACVAFWVTREAPAPPIETREDQQVRKRQLAWVARDVRRFDTEQADRIRPWDEAEGHLVIVIDDVGRELVAFERLQALRYRVTFSILPGSPYAMGSQLRLGDDPRRPRDVLLHLPMEPMGAEAMAVGEESQEDFLRLGDSEADLRRKTAAALDRIPAAIGINNHMGSRLTVDRESMGAVLDEVGARGLAFLDSRTTADTVAAEESEKRGLPTLSRAVFLDHDPDPAAMRASVASAIELAKQSPTVAIGHPSEALASVLEEELDRAWTDGVVVYPISEVWDRLNIE
jgi:polysaccharide deacetylase 2 family uncharacterized protein YibQ